MKPIRSDAACALGAYAAVMTALGGWALLGGAATPTRFDTIDVRRINVREDDGTLRMVIAGKDNIGGIIVEGREYPHPGRTEAGMIFYNDEGTENGGLVFDGRLIDGKPTNGGSLTFDRWRQDQTLQLRSLEDQRGESAGLVVTDRPARPMDFDAMARVRAMPDGPGKDNAMEAAGFGSAERAYLGSRVDRSAELALRDGAGRSRLVLRVERDGEASIRFLDEMGKVVKVTRATD